MKAEVIVPNQNVVIYFNKKDGHKYKAIKCEDHIIELLAWDAAWSPENIAYAGMGRLDWPTQFAIVDDKIFFSGSFSKYWLIKVFQVLWDRLFPKHFILKYIGVTR